MNRLIIDAALAEHRISRHCYGHFAEHLGRCIYDGIWVGEGSSLPNHAGIRRDVVEALRRLRIPNLRWPGGCFADTYHWRDGIGPREHRPSIVNIHWGGVTENNHFGTHEFLELCGLLGCEPVICGNVGSGTVQEMAEWLEYITMPGQSPRADLRRAHGRPDPWSLTYWGVGNENWGCGGNMRPEYYADEYRRYATFCRNFSGQALYRIACGANGDDYRWTEVLMREAAAHMEGLSLHHYCGFGCKNRSATHFAEADYWDLLGGAYRLEELLTRHGHIMDQYDPKRRVGLVLDEWGAWHDVEPGTNPGFLFQQNTMRDALVAGMSLNIINHHAARVRMANIAQTVNVLQAMILTEGEKMLLTPTYHVFEMYQVHHDAWLLPSRLECGVQSLGSSTLPLLSASASRNDAGRVSVTFCNFAPDRAQEVSVELLGASVSVLSGRTLVAERLQSHNRFDAPSEVVPSDGVDAAVSAKGARICLPAHSVTVLHLE